MHSCDDGHLALVATPIGNLEDITYRAVRILKEADLIAAEDTRRAQKLLSYYHVHCPVTSYHMHNEHRKTEKLLEKVRSGMKVVMLSDAGTPCISDPGYLLVREAIAAGIEPVVVPGVSALTHAAVAAGLPVSDFRFIGFLPRKEGRRRVLLRQIGEQQKTVILFESPARIARLLREITEEIGAGTQVVVVREATKRFEECLRGTAGEMVAAHGDRKWKGELTVVIQTPGSARARIPASDDSSGTQ